MRMTIGELADKAKVKIETVRYYERRGLLPEPARSSSGYRQYERDAIARIQFIKRAKLLGFTLNEIAELLLLRVDSPANCEDFQKKANDKRREIDAKIAALGEIKRSLDQLIMACEGREVTGECPILERLER